MGSPLKKRLPRELRNNIGKYLGIFLMMVLCISMGTGYMTAAESILAMLDTSNEDYLIEDAQFTTHYELAQDVRTRIESTDPDDKDKLTCTVYEDYYLTATDSTLNNSKEPGSSTASGQATMRMYKHRTEFDLAAYCEGDEPQADDEIAIDRTFADNNGLTIGDTIDAAGRTLTICGIMVLPDYQALFVDNSDFMFNSLTFGVGEVTPGCFAAYEEMNLSPTFTYAVLFDDRSLSQADRVEQEYRIGKILSDEGVSYEDLLDSSTNQGIGYANDDVSHDRIIWMVLIVLLVVIMAFVFVVLNGANIEQESAAIGTMLSLGYRKGELLRYYLTLPIIIGILAAVVGNILGVTYLGGVMQRLYYGSYSLPPYVYSFHLSVYIISTVVPLVLLIGITWWGLARKLQCTPLQFLRHEISKDSGGRQVSLPTRLSFINRFRIRVVMRNLSNFVTLFCGIMFASLLLLFGLCMMPTMEHYADNMRDDMVSEYQYTLNEPVELSGTDAQRTAYAAQHELDITDPNTLTAERKAQLEKDAELCDEDAHPINSTATSQSAIDQAEKVAVASLDAARAVGGEGEEITVYGIQKDSKYWTDLELDDTSVIIGKGVVAKCNAKIGRMLSLTNEYTGWTYDVKPTGTTGGDSTMNVYMSIDHFNELFGNDDDYFNCYVSNDALQIDSWLLASTLTPDDMNAIADQMENSMGDMMGMIAGLAVAIYLILMYLLTKTIIDHSARYISYMKVFGYRNKEVNKLYLTAITVTVIASLIVSIPIIMFLIALLMKVAMSGYAGNIVAYYPPVTLAEIILMGIVCYALVALLHTRRIKRVPLALALKVQE